jgi:VWFA-related protein
MTRTRAGCLLWAALWVQDPPGSTPPKFPAQIDLITVDTVVVDAKGNPVRGLTRDDFVLEEDGQIREILAFEAVVLPPPPRAPTPGAAAPAAPPPPRPHIARSAATAPRTGAMFLVVFDDLHLTYISAASARTTLGRFLRESTSDGDHVAIVSTATGDVWRGALPADRDDLLAFAAGLQGRLDAREPMTEHEAQRIAEYSDEDVLQRVVGRYLSQAVCAPPPFRCDAHVRAAARTNHDRWRVHRKASLELMQRAVEDLGTVRVRKAVLLLTQGFIHDGGEDAYRALVAASQRANAAVYFVDARGLEALPDSASAAAAPDVGLTLPHSLVAPPLGPIPDPGRIPMVAAATGSMTRARSERFLRVPNVGVETMADETGGFVVRNTNDLAGGLDRAARESREHYLLAFAPSPASKAGAFRKIEVRVTREGLTVRARKGYHAAGPEQTTADLSMRLATYVLAPAGEKKSRVVAVTEIETSQLTFEARDGRRVARLDFRAEAAPRDGGPSHVHRSSLEIDAPGPEPARERWNTARLEFSLPPGVFRVQASVREAAGGRTGAVTQRLEVGEPSGFGVSTPLLSDTVTPATPSAAAAPAPIAHAVFTSARPLVCAVSAWGAAKDPATGKPDVSLRFVLKDSAGQVVANSASAPVTPAADGRLEQLIALPIRQLRAGQYEMALTVEDRLAGRSEERRQTFVVERPAPPSTLAPAPRTDADLAPLLERAGRYVVEYGKAFSQVVAEENYRQEYLNERRFSRADLVFVTLPGSIPWATFRDVYEVDGHKVRDRTARLEKLFLASPAETAAARAASVLTESSRINLGPVIRSVNIPTLALLFLHPGNQGRFTFQRKGRGKVQGTEAVEVALIERARPTVVQNGAGGDAPVRGRLWIEPDSGVVLRTDVEYDLGSPEQQARARARVVTEYRREPRLGILVPTEMRERYELPAPSTRGFAIFDDQRNQDGHSYVVIEARAEYGAHRRFEVATDEAFRPQPEK